MAFASFVTATRFRNSFLVVGTLCLVIGFNFGAFFSNFHEYFSGHRTSDVSPTLAQKLFCKELFPLVTPSMELAKLRGTDQPIYLYKNGDAVSSWILGGREHEPEALKEILKALGSSASRHPLFVDVGANLGTLCLRIAGSGPNAPRVIAFEGMKANLLLLRNSICAAGLDDRVVLHPYGLSDGEAVCPIFSRNENFGDGMVACDPVTQKKYISEGCVQRGELQLKRLDAVLDEVIDVLKIDVEGFEVLVLKGAASLFRRRLVKHMLIEFWERDAVRQVEELRELEQLGFVMSLHGFSEPWASVEDVRAKIAQDHIVNIYFVLR